MRVIPTSLGLDTGGMDHALLTRLTRRDGVVVRFTSHDRNITLGAETYPARNRVVVTNIETAEGTQVGNLTLQGFLQSDELSEAELRAGLYDAAALEFLLVNWKSNPLGESLPLPRFTLGQVRFGRLTFEVELAGLMDRLQQVIGELTSPGCRVRRLFDFRCNPPGNTTPTSNPAQFRHLMDVLEVRTSRILVFGPTDTQTEEPDYFRAGILSWQTGENAPQEMEMKAHTPEPGVAVVTLQLPMPFAVALGDTAQLEKGCWRDLARCRDGFQNVINGQFEPHLPGTDSVLSIIRK